MKSLLKFPALLLGLFLFAGTTQKANAQYDDVSLQTFYDELSPYGTWINDPEYGYVWRPDVDQREFRPYYSNGRWAMTEYGNTWVSNYDWGWAPFHYGRWMYNRYNNWVWLPDTVWGPAWVNWRSGGGNYGWAPMGPNISININIGRRYVMPDFCWSFIPQANIYYNNYPRYYSGRNRVYIQNTVIINNTYINNNRTYYSGPRIDDVRRATNQNVTVYKVSRSSDRPSSRIENNRLNVYTPRPSRGSDNASAMPRKAVEASVTRERVDRNAAIAQTPSRSDRDASNDSQVRGDRNVERRADESNRVDRSATAPQDTRRNDRGTYSADQVRGERNADRRIDDANVNRSRGTDYQTPSRTRTIDNTASQPNRVDDRNVMERTRGNAPTMPSSPERSSRGVETRTAPPAPERNQTYSAPSRSSSEGRTSTPYSPPQRSAEAAPQRVERVQQSSGPNTSRSSGSTSAERTTRSEGSGRPGRG